MMRGGGGGSGLQRMPTTGATELAGDGRPRLGDRRSRSLHPNCLSFSVKQSNGFLQCSRRQDGERPCYCEAIQCQEPGLLRFREATGSSL